MPTKQHHFVSQVKMIKFCLKAENDMIINVNNNKYQSSGFFASTVSFLILHIPNPFSSIRLILLISGLYNCLDDIGEP